MKTMTRKDKMIAGAVWSMLEVKNPTTVGGKRLSQASW
jgi:hypothetical protein